MAQLGPVCDVLYDTEYDIQTCPVAPTDWVAEGMVALETGIIAPTGFEFWGWYGDGQEGGFLPDEDVDGYMTTLTLQSVVGEQKVGLNGEGFLIFIRGDGT